MVFKVCSGKHILPERALMCKCHLDLTRHNPILILMAWEASVCYIAYPFVKQFDWQLPIAMSHLSRSRPLVFGAPSSLYLCVSSSGVSYVLENLWVSFCSTRTPAGPRWGRLEWPFPPPRARMLSGSKPLPRAVSQSMVQPQLGSLLMSVASGTSGGLRNHVR